MKKKPTMYAQPLMMNGVNMCALNSECGLERFMIMSSENTCVRQVFGASRVRSFNFRKIKGGRGKSIDTMIAAFVGLFVPISSILIMKIYHISRCLIALDA